MSPGHDGKSQAVSLFAKHSRSLRYKSLILQFISYINTIDNRRMNLLQFDLNLLLVFDAIYRHNNLSVAAGEMGLTQPAVSAALKRLRLRFGNPLFVRTSRGMRPTPYGDDLAPKVSQALKILREMDQPNVFLPATTEINYRVYINDIGLIVLMPAVLKYLRETAPRARITILDLRPDEVVDALDRGDVDLAIGYFLGMPNWAHQQNLRNTSYVCAVRKDHPRIGNSLTLEQFLQCRHAMYDTSGSLHNRVEQALAKINRTRDVALTVPRFSALPFLVMHSDLIVTVPEDLGVLFSKLIDIKILRPPLQLASFQIKQYWHERLHAEPAHKWFRQVVRSMSEDIGAPRARTAGRQPSP